MLNIPSNSRTYSHQLREHYDKFMTRVDFTQTILFESAQNLTSSTSGEAPKHSTNFFLNDQISQFEISVNLFSSKGKYAIAKKVIKSSTSAYSQLTLPTTMINGDKIEIPITVTNNRNENQNMRLVAKKYTLKPQHLGKRLVETFNEDV
jgi:hypothetical protein